MAKLDNLLLILHLLMSRRCVTVDLIVNKCQISERTAYRYLRSVDIAGFPLIYEKELGGYRLVNRSGVFAHLSATELGAVYLGIDVLESLLSPEQMELFRRVKLKLESYMTSDVQKELTSMMRSLATVSDATKIRDHLLISFLKSAQDQHKSIRLHYRCGTSDLQITDLAKPCLQFEREWRLSSENDDCQQPIALSDVVDFEILNEK